MDLFNSGEVEMKIIKIKGCVSCPYCYPRKDLNEPKNAICEKEFLDLDIIWSVNPYYSHKDCPLEEMKE